jgi:peptidoglycan/xylan/chitin deacetylase (PgdA/CDA1 family)
VYHAVNNIPLPHIKYYNFKNCRQFETDIIYLKKNFDLPSYDTFIAAVKAGSRPPRDMALVTFDDGFSQCFSAVRPILKKHQVPAVFFITTGFINNKRLLPEQKASLCIDVIQRSKDKHLRIQLKSLSKAAHKRFASPKDAVRYLRGFDTIAEPVLDRFCAILGRDTEAYARQTEPFLTSQQIQQLAREGFIIGAHTHSHTRLDLLDDDRIQEEITHSCTDIMKITGARHLPFAFPHHGRFVDRLLLAKIMRDCPYIDLIFDSRWLRKDHPFILNRVAADKRPSSKTNGSNLPTLIKYAYTDALLNRCAPLPK